MIKNSITKYRKNNIKRIYLELNKKTEKDLVNKINIVNNRNGYIKYLIKNDEIIYTQFKKQ